MTTKADERRERVRTLQVAEIEAEAHDLGCLLAPLADEAGKPAVPADLRTQIIAWLQQTSGKAQQFADTLDRWNTTQPRG